MMHYHCWVCK